MLYKQPLSFTVAFFSLPCYAQSVRTLPKRSLIYVPGFGWLLWALECIFLTRNFAKDEQNILRHCREYKDYPFPIQVMREGEREGAREGGSKRGREGRGSFPSQA